MHSWVKTISEKAVLTERCDFRSIFATVFDFFFSLWSVCCPSSPHTVSDRTSNWASPFLFQHIRPKIRFCPARFCYADGFQQRAADVVSSKCHRAPPQSFLYVQYEGVGFDASWTGYGVIADKQEVYLYVSQLCALCLHHLVCFSSQGHTDSCSIRLHSVSWVRDADTQWLGAGGVQSHACTRTLILNSKLGS